MVSFDDIRRYQDGLSRYGIGGNDLAVYSGFKPIYRHFAGFRNMEKQLPIDGNTSYRMFSMTKPVTVTAAMQLYEQGKFLLNDPLSRYLPEFAEMTVRHVDADGSETIVPAKNPILIKHLFTMTAGFGYAPETPKVAETVKRMNGTHTLKDIVKCISETPLLFEPGTHWFYSYGHDVLARVVEVLSGMRFSEYVKKNVLEPLGITKSSHHPSKEVWDQICSVTRWTEDKTMEVVPEYGSVWYGSESCDGGGAGLLMTVDDYAKFATAMANRGLAENGVRILGSGTVDIMRTNCLKGVLLDDFQHSSKNREGYGYGLGVRTLIDKSYDGNPASIGEYGWSGVLGTYVLMDPDRQLTIVYAEQVVPDMRRPGISRTLRNMVYSALEYEKI